MLPNLRPVRLVVLEDLHVAGIKSNRDFTNATSDSGRGEFRSDIKDETQFYGKRVIAIDRWNPWLSQ